MHMHRALKLIGAGILALLSLLFLVNGLVYVVPGILARAWDIVGTGAVYLLVGCGIGYSAYRLTRL